MGEKTLLSYCFKTLYLRRKVSKIPILPCLPFKPLIMPACYLYKIISLPFPSLPLLRPIYIYIYILLAVPLFII